MSGYEDLRDLVEFAPLQQRPPAQSLKVSPFSAPWTRTVELLAREIKMLDPGKAILEIDLPAGGFRRDGLPRADRRAFTPTVVLTMVRTKHGHDLRYEVGTYDDWQDNVRAIALGLEALRAVDRYGVTKRGEQYAGWKQLPAGGWTDEAVKRGRELIAAVDGDVRRALKQHHPDVGGDEADFKAIQAASGMTS